MHIGTRIALTDLNVITLNLISVDSRMSSLNPNNTDQSISLKNITTEIPAFYPANKLLVNATQNNSAVRLVKGKFQRIRRWLAAPLIALFIVSPWLTMNGHPVLQMDLETRQLHLFGINFWPDDLLILLWVAMGSAFALFAVASFAGRLWCGFTCPQTVWSMIFVWVEENIEGSRNQRLKQKHAPLNAKRIRQFVIKHAVWLILSFITGFTFVAFFETGPILFENLISLNIGSDIVFWLVFFTALTYINAGWLREQVCLHMCPYSRFQSVMLDSKSLKVSYDVNRGEPRKNHTVNTQGFPQYTADKPSPDLNTGDCINCQLCVQVCPVGIDIRQGMQYACIDCGACIDACDQIMEKIEKPKGLIRFSNELHQHWTELFKNRTRLIGYGVLTAVSILGFILQVSTMESFDVHLTKERSQLYFYSGEGSIKNAYILKLHNKTSANQQYDITINQLNSKTDNLKLEFYDSIHVAPGERSVKTLFISCKLPCALEQRTPIAVKIRAHLKSISDTEEKIINSTFFNDSQRKTAFNQGS